jgi:hypothetical protein
VPGACLELHVSPSVGTVWLTALARVLDADVARHIHRNGTVALRLRVRSSEEWALSLLATMPGVLSAQKTPQKTPPSAVAPP